MATTSPDNIWTPDSGDDYALTVDLAATADTVQTGLNNRVSKDPKYSQHQNKVGSVNQPSGIEIPQSAVNIDKPLIIKTGVIAEATTNSFGNEYLPTVAFADAFPNAVLGIHFTSLSGGNTTVNRVEGTIACDSLTRFQFRPYIPNSPNPWYRSVAWMAVGY